MAIARQGTDAAGDRMARVGPEGPRVAIARQGPTPHGSSDNGVKVGQHLIHLGEVTHAPGHRLPVSGSAGERLRPAGRRIEEAQGRRLRRADSAASHPCLAGAGQVARSSRRGVVGAQAASTWPGPLEAGCGPARSPWSCSTRARLLRPVADVGVVGAVGGLVDGQGPLEQRPGAGQVAQVPQDQAEVVEARCRRRGGRGRRRPRRWPGPARPGGRAAGQVAQVLQDQGRGC